MDFINAPFTEQPVVVEAVALLTDYDFLLQHWMIWLPRVGCGMCWTSRFVEGVGSSECFLSKCLTELCNEASNSVCQN